MAETRNDSTKAEAPKYRLNHTSYIGDIMYLAGDDGPVDKETGERKPVYYIDKDNRYTPGPHWEPVNEAAKAKALACGIVYTGQVPDSMDKLVGELEAAKQRRTEQDNMAIGRGVVAALTEMGFVPKPPKARAEAGAEI